MKKNLNENQWIEEFDEFLSSDQLLPPKNISDQIIINTKKMMNPSAWIVFLKLLSVHSVFGTLSLAICNQFGLNPFNTHLSLSEYFMTFGHSFCMTLCGVIFVGFSIVAAWMILNRDEFNTLKKNYLIQICSLSLLSLSVFVALGADVTLGLAILWFLGALVGGAIPTWGLAHKKIQFA